VFQADDSSIANIKLQRSKTQPKIQRFLAIPRKNVKAVSDVASAFEFCIFILIFAF